MSNISIWQLFKNPETKTTKISQGTKFDVIYILVECAPYNKVILPKSIQEKLVKYTDKETRNEKLRRILEQMSYEDILKVYRPVLSQCLVKQGIYYIKNRITFEYVISVNKTKEDVIKAMNIQEPKVFTIQNIETRIGQKLPKTITSINVLDKLMHINGSYINYCARTSDSRGTIAIFWGNKYLNYKGINVNERCFHEYNSKVKLVCEQGLTSYTRVFYIKEFKK